MKRKIVILLTIMLLLVTAYALNSYALEVEKEPAEDLVGEVFDYDGLKYEITDLRENENKVLSLGRMDPSTLPMICVPNYHKIKITQPGIITFRATKPVADNGMVVDNFTIIMYKEPRLSGGKYIQLKLDVPYLRYFNYKNPDATEYVLKCCVQPGTYYVSFDMQDIYGQYSQEKPITSTYHYEFEPVANIELQSPNNSATPIKLETEYKAVAEHDRKIDKYKFTAGNNKKYRVYLEAPELWTSYKDINFYIYKEKDYIIKPLGIKDVKFDSVKNKHYFEFSVEQACEMYLQLDFELLKEDGIDPYTGLKRFWEAFVPDYVYTIEVKDLGKGESSSFKDIKLTDWYSAAAEYCNANGIITGYKDGSFAPNDKLTRGMLVTILYKMEGQPAVSGTMPFKDVPSSEYYYNAVKWASQNKIVNGYGEGKFAPNDNIKRQDLAIILYNYARYKNKDLTKINNLSGFTDVSKIDSYAMSQLKWAVGSGVITGNKDKTLNPQGQSSRAEAAAMIEKYCKQVGK